MNNAAAASPSVPSPAQWAKGALRRLALARQEPTPANFARAYAEESGQPAEPTLPARARPLLDKLAARVSDETPQRETLARALAEGRWDDLQRCLDSTAERAGRQAAELADLIALLARGLERGSREWTSARKKESLQRVLEGSRSDSNRLQQRLRQLVAAWDGGGDAAAAPPAEADNTAAPTAPAALTAPAVPTVPVFDAPALANPGTPGLEPTLAAAGELAATLNAALVAALPPGEARAAEVADELAALAQRVARDGITAPLVADVAQACERARRLLAHRHHLVEGLSALCRSLTQGLGELSEDDSWVQGQCQALEEQLRGDSGVLTARGVRAAGDLLEATRARQRELRGDRDRARLALKDMIGRMLAELGELGQHTGHFTDKVSGYAQVIEQAESLESLAAVVHELVDESRAVHTLVTGTRERLAADHARASELENKVRLLEGELRRLSEEVSTDVLTQVANRRGMMQLFETERARVEREAGELAIGLIDIDNFKKLNDSLGHAAGDVALKALAARVKGWLRPVDHIARFGGEEFVVLLPATPVGEAQQVLTRLQRQLTASLFMHDGKEVFVTFSAGVTTYRPGETIEAALERADEGLYEAKRTGKNRTCIT